MPTFFVKVLIIFSLSRQLRFFLVILLRTFWLFYSELFDSFAPDFWIFINGSYGIM